MVVTLDKQIYLRIVARCGEHKTKLKFHCDAVSCCGVLAIFHALFHLSGFAAEKELMSEVMKAPCGTLSWNKFVLLEAPPRFVLMTKSLVVCGTHFYD